MKVVFLDFDGVLTTPATKYRFGYYKCVNELNRITFLTKAEIVVSSTWRIQGLQAVRENLFRWGVAGVPYDITPRLLDDASSRGDEIKQWLAENTYVNRFVILDDDTDMGKLSGYLIKCDTNVGLTSELANLAIQKLL